MEIHAHLAPEAWRPWTVRLPAVLATGACLFLGTIGWFFVVALTGYGCAMDDGPATAECAAGVDWWLVAAGLGQLLFATSAIVLGIRGHDRPGSRLFYAIACWLVIPLAAGWFVLCVRASP